MKLVHISDLHLGKRVNGFSMLDDQQYILNEMLNIIKSESVSAVLISGDVYDKTIPPAEAVALFDRFLTGITSLGAKALIISGNHDSAERLAFGRSAMTSGGIYIAPVFSGTVAKTILTDEYGNINVYMLPFLKPLTVRPFYEDIDIPDTESAVKAVLDGITLDKKERNIIMAHQFITGAERSDSEEVYVGGLDNVGAELFAGFDYTALGHIHRPQNIGGDKIRYCGTPIKYSFSEINDKKSVTVIDMKEKNNVSVKAVPLVPLRDMRHIKGSYAEVTDRAGYINTATDDYLYITLTDEEDVFDAIGRLRSIYPNIMKIDYENKRTSADNFIDTAGESVNKSPAELFGELYELQNNSPMSAEQKVFLDGIIKDIWEAEK